MQFISYILSENVDLNLKSRHRLRHVRGTVAISGSDDLAHGVVQGEAEHLDVRFVTACNGLVTAL